MECELAYAISRIDPEQEGIDLLSHDLSAVREGAWLGIGKTKRADLLEKLYQIRTTTEKPWERHASYRAMDHLLINIEEFGNKEDLSTLEKFYESIKHKQGQLSAGPQTRLEWTIERLKERSGS